MRPRVGRRSDSDVTAFLGPWLATGELLGEEPDGPSEELSVVVDVDSEVELVLVGEVGASSSTMVGSDVFRAQRFRRRRG